MESFPDRAHVRLRNRELGTYLHADEDGWGVSLSPHRASPNTAWTVHLVPAPQTGATYVLLHSAAYGRYLGVRYEPAEGAPPAQAQAQGHGVFFVPRMVQCVYDAPLQPDVVWEVQSTGDGTGDVLLRLLGRNNPNEWSNSPWSVEAVPPRPAPPQLPEETPNGVVAPVVLSRLIRYIRANHSGISIWTSRGTLQFEGRHLRDLIGDLANQLNDNINNITVCVRAGFCGRRTPLVVDLPLSEETVDLVILSTGSAAALELQHPDVDAA